MTFALIPLTTIVGQEQDSIEVKDEQAIKNDSSKLNLSILNASDLDKYKSDGDFNYQEAKYSNSFLSAIKQWFVNLIKWIFEKLFGHENGVKYADNFMKIMKYVLLAVLIFVLLKYLLGLNYKDLFKKSPGEANIIYYDDDEMLLKSDIDKLIEKASEEGNYRLALRYYYLKLINILDQKHYIKWEPEKTNFEYLKEIKNEEIGHDFRLFTQYYDYIWYGYYDLDSSHYNDVSAEFNRFFNALNSGDGKRS